LFSKHTKRSVEHLLTLRVVSATFRFWPVFSFSGSLLMMLFAFLYSYKHPIFFFINASANQSLNRQDCRPSNKLTRYTNVLAPILIMISLEVKSKRSMDSQARQVLWKSVSIFYSRSCASDLRCRFKGNGKKSEKKREATDFLIFQIQKKLLSPKKIREFFLFNKDHA
jgi:hypothetical protein